MRSVFRRIGEIIIPTVYSDALSYGEMMEKIRCVLVEIANWINKRPHVFTINGKSGEVTLSKLKFTGYTNAEYNGADEITVKIPVSPPDGSIAELNFEGGYTGTYDGTEAITVEIPNVKSVNGRTGDVILDANSVGAVRVGELPQTLPNPLPLIITKGACQTEYDGSETVAISLDGTGDGAVKSVNGQTGEVILRASDVGAIPVGAGVANPYPLTLRGAVNAVYNGAFPVEVTIPAGGGEGAVSSVNGQTGAVTLDANAVGAIPNSITTLPNPQAIRFTGFDTETYDGRIGVNVNIPDKVISRGYNQTIGTGSESISVIINSNDIGLNIVTLEGEAAVNFGSLGLDTQSAHRPLMIAYDPVTATRSFMFNITASNVNTPLSFYFTRAIQYASRIDVNRILLG